MWFIDTKLSYLQRNNIHSRKRRFIKILRRKGRACSCQTRPPACRTFKRKKSLQAEKFRHCAQHHHRHPLSSVCRRGGEGKGPCGSLCCGLSFPTPPLWFPVLWFHVLPLNERRGLGEGGGIPWGGGLRRGDAAPCIQTPQLPAYKPHSYLGL